MYLLTHLYKNYARISPSDMAANDERLRAQYNAKEPIESLIERLNECADFTTAAGETVSDTQLFHIAYVLVAETGQYPEGCRAWRNQDDKSWTTFQGHFIGVYATSGRGNKTHARVVTEPTTWWASRNPSQTSLIQRQRTGWQ